MGDRRHVDEVLVVEEFIFFRRHQMPVEAEQLSERLRIVHLDRLIRRPEALEFTQRANEKAAVLGEVFGQHARLKVAKRHFIGHRALRDGSPGI